MPTIVSLLIEIVCSVPIVADNKGGSSELDQDLYIKEQWCYNISLQEIETSIHFVKIWPFMCKTPWI